MLLPDDFHNRRLVANVHPADWMTPQPRARYNLVVVGGGTAGLVGSIGTGILGGAVALIERHLLGGDCLNFGCVPSKALVRAARVFHSAKGGDTFGVRGGGALELDFARVMERMRRARADISEHDSARQVSAFGVDVFLGAARFIARDAIEVDGRVLRFARALIATGGRPRVPSIPGLLAAGYLDTESVFSLTELPRRLTVIGAGPVGCELAQAFCRFGSTVTLLTRAERVLPREDADVSELLARQLRSEGVTLVTRAEVHRIEQRHGKQVCFSSNGAEQSVSADEILVAVGREPNTEGLGLETAGVRFDEHGIGVNEQLRTSNRRVYAAGDVCSKLKFTHVADAMARVALENALFFGRKKLSAQLVPWCTFTDPEIAHVGVGEKEAYERGFKSYTVPLADMDRALVDGEAEGFARIHVGARGRIAGASVVAAGAGELISEIALAMTAGIPLGTLGRTIHPYPTRGEVWKRLADEWNRERLTPALRRLLGSFLALRR